MYDICVLGLGYIGLPTASVLATHGFRVLGVDVSAAVADTVNEGRIHIEEPGLATLVKAAIGSGNLRAATAPEPAEVYIIAVPTPITEDKRADLSCVRAAAESIVPLLAPGCLVILESTSPPGTCRDVLGPILESGGLRVGADIQLAHCPERVLPGRILHELTQNDRIVGGVDEASAARARELYARFAEGRIFVTSAAAAETAKLFENTYRDVNIALANEMALLCEHLGLDFWEVAALANRHPRVNIHQAGPGVGGHCIPVDPWFLTEAAPEETQLIRLARERNDAMPAHVAQIALEMMHGADAPKVAALGIAYKGNVDDLRESPALEVCALLREAGAEVAAHDPYVTRASFPLLPLEECLRGADLALTAHAA